MESPCILVCSIDDKTGYFDMSRHLDAHQLEGGIVIYRFTAALFFAIVITGAEAMSRATGIPVYLADVIQGTALITMLIALMFTRYRLRWAGRAAA